MSNRHVSCRFPLSVFASVWLHVTLLATGLRPVCYRRTGDSPCRCPSAPPSDADVDAMRCDTSTLEDMKGEGGWRGGRSWLLELCLCVFCVRALPSRVRRCERRATQSFMLE